MKAKVIEYNIPNGPIQRKISTSIKVICQHFLLALSANLRYLHLQKFVTLTMQVKVMMYNIHSGAIRWQIPDFISDGNSNVQHICSAYLSKQPLENFYLGNVGYSRGVQQSIWTHSMAHINLYKSHTLALLASSHHFRDIHISKFVTLKMQVKVMMCNSQWQIPDFLSDGNACIFISVYLSYIHLKRLFLKMQVKVMEYNIHNGSIRWLIATSIKVVREQFLLTLNGFHIYNYYIFQKFCDLKIQVKVTMQNIYINTIRLQIQDFPFDGNSN